MYMHSFKPPPKKKNKLKDIQDFRIPQSHKGEKDFERLGSTSRSLWLKHKGQASEWPGVAYCLKASTLKEDAVGSGSS